MFRKISSLKATSDDDIVVSVRLGFLHYHEGQRHAVFPTDAGKLPDGRESYVVCLSLPVKWEAPFEAEIVSEKHRQEIKSNILEALEAMDGTGCPVEIDD